MNLIKKRNIIVIFLLLSCLFSAVADCYIKVYVSNVSDAWVYIDGSNKGKAPVNVKVSPGSHTVKVEKTGYKTCWETVYAKDGYNYTVTVTMEKENGKIYATANVSLASVYLDGHYEGRTPLTIFDVTPGLHTIRFSKDSYYDVVETVNVSAGLTSNVKANFIGATLKISAHDENNNPLNATVYIDDEKYGTTPAYIEDIVPGYHTVEAYKKHYKHAEKQILFAAKYIHTFTATMPKISGYLQIQTEPENAEITIKDKDNTSLGNNLYEIDNGECSVTARAFGYEDKTIIARVDTNETTYETITLNEADFAITTLSTNIYNINPNNKNVRNTVTITWGVTAPETGTLTIKNSDDKIVKTESVSFTDWTGSTVWDGKTADSTGAALPQGKYYITLSCQNQSETVSIDIDYSIKDYIQHARGDVDSDGLWVFYMNGADSIEYKGIDWGLNYLFGGKHVYGGVDFGVLVAKQKMNDDNKDYIIDIDAILGFSFNINSMRPYIQTELGYYKEIEGAGGLMFGFGVGMEIADPVVDWFVVGVNYMMKNYINTTKTNCVSVYFGFTPF